MSPRPHLLTAWVLSIAILSAAGGCKPSTTDTSSAPASTVAVGTVADSVLTDSMTAALDRYTALPSPTATDRAKLRQWAQAGQARADSLRDTRPAQARLLFEWALQLYRQVGDSTRVATTLWRLGQINEHESQHDAARDRYRSALAASRAVENRPQTAKLLHDIGDVQRDRGHYEDALSHYRSSLSIRRALGDQAAIARTLNNGALALEYQGRYDEALTWHREALSIRRTIDDREGIASTLNNVGIIQAIRGRYEKALSRWEESLALKRELGDREGAARTLNNLGNLYKNQGRYGTALSRVQDALTIFRDLGNQEEMATALNTLGTIRKRQGRYEQALSRYEASLAIKRERDDRQGIARTLHNIGVIYYRQGRYEEALSHHRVSLSLKRELGDRRGIANSLTNIGDVYDQRGRIDAALHQYRRALEMNQEMERRGGSARDLRNIGVVHLNAGHLPAATDTLERSIRLAEQLRRSATSPEARRSLLETQIDAYRALTTAHLRADRPDAALRSLERARARLLADRLAGTARGDTTVTVPPAADLRRGLGPDEAALLYANANSNRPLTAVVATRDTTYAHALPGSAVRADVGRAYADRLRRLRQEEGAPVTALGDAPTGSPDARPSLAATIRLYRSLLTREAVSDSLRRDLGQRLYGLLIEPVAHRLQAHETVTVVPTGTLGYLPFEALRGPEAKYLVQRTHLRYAQSLSVLRQLQDRPSGQAERPLLAVGGAAYGGSSPSTDGPLLDAVRGDTAVGSDEQAAALFRSAERRLERGESPRSTYDRLGYGSWPPLYGTKLEVKKLRRAMGPEATQLTGPTASEGRVRTLSASGRLARYRHVHFATHGVVVPEAPALSALVLSQTNASDQRAARDGYLTMREIADLHLRADVAVLSACRTGLGRLVAGEGVVSLSHAFLRAGANATLVSQWRVLDWSTQQFMTATYRRAQADTTSFAEAVTQVKRAFIEGQFGARNTDPIRWAPFVYYGRESRRPTTE